MTHQVGRGGTHWSGEVWIGTEIKCCIFNMLIGITGYPSEFMECHWGSKHNPLPSLSDSKVHALSILQMSCFSLYPFLNITVFTSPWVSFSAPFFLGTSKHDLTSFNMELSSSGISADLLRVSDRPEAMGQVFLGECSCPCFDPACLLPWAGPWHCGDSWSQGLGWGLSRSEGRPAGWYVCWEWATDTRSERRIFGWVLLLYVEFFHF